MQEEIKQGPVFVNAKDRTPDHDGVVHLKIGQLNRVGNFFDNAIGKGVYIQGHEPWTLTEDKFDGVFWLDESGQSNEQPGEQKENILSVFVPCAEDDPRCCGGYTSSDGQSLCYVREVNLSNVRKIGEQKENDAVTKLVEFARDCAYNWDCDTDGHKYNTGCRKCDSKELYNEYQKQKG